MRFSQRMGIVSVRDVFQRDTIDDGMKNGIWTILHISLWEKMQEQERWSPHNVKLSGLFLRLWHHFFKLPID
ncbi:MAG TPA: hypothetical protein VHP34_07460, partial [Alphaproteobacteria bacterium]|nr:hypothetical protein [Alphaproteobacteria bacterium]